MNSSMTPILISLAFCLFFNSKTALADRHLLDGIIVERDIEYAKVGSQRLKLDLYLPKKPKAAILPVIVWIHGGGWEQGSKSSGSDRLSPLVASGSYIGVSIDYRLTNVAIWPAQLGDINAAIHWIRTKGDQFYLDARSICVWGTSAGGHLASLIGTRTSNISCVLDMSGPSDLISLAISNPELYAPQKPVFKLIGGPLEVRKLQAQDASPINFITSNDSTFLILHGTNDSTVSIQQSEIFYERLSSNGIEAKIMRIEGAGHKLEGPEIDAIAKAFFDAQLISHPGIAKLYQSK